MIKECVIASIPDKKSMFIVKNRDRNYIPKIELNHRIINSIEVFYYKDEYTGWIEGINEHGVAIINSSLTVQYDEKEMKLASENKSKGDGQKILEALTKKDIKEVIQVLWNKNYKLFGHTFINFKDKSYSVECTPNSKVFIRLIKDIKVETNHGRIVSKAGYIKGKSKLSTMARQIISQHELDKLNSSDPDEVLDVISKDYINWKDQYSPYRRNNNIQKGLNEAMWTTMQILFDTINLYCQINYPSGGCIINKKVISLPDNYKSKIKYKIKKQ